MATIIFAVKRIAAVKSAKHKNTIPSAKKIPQQNKAGFYIAAIGASAGGLEALRNFFKHTSPDSGIAYVVIQHLDPNHKSILAELISGYTQMKVFEITDGIEVLPNCVYVIPPNRDLRIIGNHLKLVSQDPTRAMRRPIDSFFCSLAKTAKNRAIGIVLSGTGTEGTLGLKDIKNAGGITLAQEPSTAEFPGMPQSAIVSKAVDYVLSPEQLPAQIQNAINVRKSGKAVVSKEISVPEPDQLKAVFQIIRNQTGYDFSEYKSNTISRRIMKRCALAHVNNFDEYLQILKRDPLEVEQLYKNFLIGVTSFFRDKNVFDCVEKKAIPYIVQNCIKGNRDIRIWVCGCSTGEEAYSFAILFREAAEKLKSNIEISIFASDLDKEAVAIARSGIFSENSLTTVSKDRIARFFVRTENGFQMRKEIREMVVFAHHNLTNDPPFSKLDMISCRNVLIYMNSDLQKKVIPMFHYGLNDGGLLLLGTSESVGENSDLFSPYDNSIKLYKKNQVLPKRKNKTDYDLSGIHQRTDTPVNLPSVIMEKKTNLSGLAEKILADQYAPPSVIIDKNNNALYFSGNTSPFLEQPRGEARLNILEMAKMGLRTALEAAIKKARSGKKQVQTKSIEINVNNKFTGINLVVKPILSKIPELGTLMVIFESAEMPNKNSAVPESAPTGKNKIKTSELEKELRITKEHLQAAIDELKTSNEDLQTSNEEYQSSHEELQSTNEELETSREELQSVNEELITVNTELSGKIEQLSQANDDLNNLLSSIEVATVFLDKDLKIKRFTPAATKIFNLISTDIDRPVTHLSGNILYKALADDVKSALKTLAVRTADVQAIDSTWYHMRILPYRTAENIIEGVLVTFVDITEQKNTEGKLKKTNEHLNIIMENLTIVPFTCEVDENIHFSFVGKSCEKVTGFLPEQFTRKASFWMGRVHPGDKKRLRAAFSTIEKKGSLNFPFRWKCADGKYKTFDNYIRYAAQNGGTQAYVVGIWQEIQNDNKGVKVRKNHVTKRK